MAETAEYESLEGLFESESEFAEARRPIPRPSSKPSFQKRTPPSYVTQVQLEAALARVDGKIKTVADGVSSLNSRVGALTTNIKKEAEERKKESQSQKSDLNQKLQMLALLPLLTPRPTFTIPAVFNAGTATTPASFANGASTTIQADSGGTLNALLPLLLISGIGGPGGLGGGTDSGMDSSMLLVLALVLSQPNK
jgi:hypothetical protein